MTHAHVVLSSQGAKVPNGWEVTGNSDILNQAGIVVASCVILGAILLVGFRYYKQRGYTPVTEGTHARVSGVWCLCLCLFLCLSSFVSLSLSLSLCSVCKCASVTSNDARVRECADSVASIKDRQ